MTSCRLIGDVRLGAVLIAVVALGAAPALACTCAPVTALDAVASGEGLHVFTGRVVKVVAGVKTEYSILEVDRVWSGTLFRHTVIPIELSSCGHPDLWTEGTEHLLVTNPDDALIFSVTNNCYGNEELAKAGATIAALGPARRPLPDALVMFPVLFILVVAGLVLRRQALRSPRARSR